MTFYAVLIDKYSKEYPSQGLSKSECMEAIRKTKLLLKQLEDRLSYLRGLKQ